MLILYGNQEEKIKKTISKYVHDFYKGKLEINFFSWGFDNYSGEGYRQTFKKGLLKYIEIEKYIDNQYFNKYYVKIILNDNQTQKHTFNIKLSKRTNKIEYR